MSGAASQKEEFALENQLWIDGRAYAVRVQRPNAQPASAPRLVIVAFQPNDVARQLLRVCIRSIQHFTPEPHELWVVDNNSPLDHARWLLEWPSLNVILNRTEPVPPGADTTQAHTQQHHSSYANAVALELAVRLIDPRTEHLVTLHMDTAPCHLRWLAFLRSRLNDRIRAAGVRLDRVRVPEGVLHVLGCLVDFQLFQQLNLNFLPDLPRYDVGDRVTVALRAAGYEVFACPNTLWQPELIQTIPVDSPLQHLSVDRAFDAEGNVIFLHLGRGVRQAQGRARARQVSIDEWVELAEKYLLISAGVT